MALDILIKNGTVIDGLGTPGFRADIGIKDGKIKRIGFLGEPSVKTRIDASDLYVAPGFIDINNASDRYYTLFSHPNMESYLYQGVTTVIGGNCGSSLAPLTSGNIIANIQKWADTRRINVDWLSTEDFLEEVLKKKLILNFGTLTGHSTLRRGIVGDKFRQLDKDELSKIKYLLEKSLKQGALGFSTALNYSHVKMASDDEIFSLVSSLGSDRLYGVHLKDEKNDFLNSIAGAIEMAKKTKANIEISHLKALGKNNWPLFSQGIEMIEKASSEGLNINFDVYPYSSTATVFYTLFPDWIAVGGRMKLIENLKNAELKNKLITEMRGREEEFENIVVASGNIDKTFIGKTIGNIAKNQNAGVLEAAVNLLIAAEGMLVVFWPALSEENFIRALKSPLSIIASDGAAYSLDDAKDGLLIHPRSFGCFTRILGRYAWGKNVLSFEEAVKKMTALPALKANLHHRGVLQDGYFADIVIFDPASIKDLATFENPFQYSIGIHSVIINGKEAVSNGKIKNAGLGQVL